MLLSNEYDRKMPRLEPDFDRRHSGVPPVDTDHLLAEFQQVFAEVIASAESRSELSDEQREEAALAIEQAMESTRRMVERLTTKES